MMMIMLAPIIANILQTIHHNYIWNRTAPVVYKITTISSERSGGTGFLVLNNKGTPYIISNKHVCEGVEENGMVAIRLSWATIYSKFELDPNSDLCKIKTNLPNGLRLSNHLYMYEPVVIVGHPRLYPLHMTIGHYQGPFEVTIEGDTFDARKFSAHTLPGNSGSPILDMFGNVVGVLFAGGPLGSLGISLEELKRFINK